MTDLFDIEREAQRLERHLASGLSPEVQLLVALGFFRLLRDNPHLCDPDPYLMQFLPRLARAATEADPKGFFPDEADALAEFAAWVGQVGGVAHAGAPEAVAQLAAATRRFLRGCVGDHNQEGLDRDTHGEVVAVDDGDTQRAVIASEAKQSPALKLLRRFAPRNDSMMGPPQRGGRSDETALVALNCLFVEHFPDLDLPPRGRLLKLTVTATPISKKADADDIVVRNPVTKPDDRFLAQARDSVKAARAHMQRRYGLPLSKRYRFDFAVDSSGARFTGDSLGVAFAAGTIAAIGKIEVLRERLSIAPDAAFSGALSADGDLVPVDGEALRRKIDRAFFSRLKFLVIPRENITEAWTYLSGLETNHPGRKLELVGADTLHAIAGDPRLVLGERFSGVGYAARKAWKTKRAPAVEVSVLMAAVAVLLVILWPYFDRNPATVRITGNGFEAVNEFGKGLWAKTYLCDSLFLSLCWVVVDLDGDGMNEVLFSPEAGHLVGKGTRLEVFKSNGDTLFSRDMVIRNEYVGDSVPPDQSVYYTPYVTVAHLRQGPLIITGAFQHNPARQHLKIWNPDGSLRGWYINAGGVSFSLASDLTGDGREELIFKAFNNRMGCSGVFAIRSDSSYGCSPPYEDFSYEIGWVERGNQAAYTLFPVTDVGKIDLPQRYNTVKRFGESTGGVFVVSIQESNPPLDADVDYYLDDGLHLIRASANDPFRKRRDDLVANGSLPSFPWSEYDSRLGDTVIYWIGSGWVSQRQLRTSAKP